MNIWVPLTGDESLVCQKENVYDPHVMAIIRAKVVVGHVPQNICSFFWTFLSLPITLIRAQVPVNRSTANANNYGQEIPACFVF